MQGNCLEKTAGMGAEERRKTIRAICTKYAKRIKLCGYDWKRLSAFADKAYADAARAFSRGDYQEFELNLLLYSDVWRFARDHLKPGDYRYFCHGQYKPPELEFQ